MPGSHRRAGMNRGQCHRSLVYPGFDHDRACHSQIIIVATEARLNADLASGGHMTALPPSQSTRFLRGRRSAATLMSLMDGKPLGFDLPPSLTAFSAPLHPFKQGIHHGRVVFLSAGGAFMHQEDQADHHLALHLVPRKRAEARSSRQRGQKQIMGRLVHPMTDLGKGSFKSRGIYSIRPGK